MEKNFYTKKNLIDRIIFIFFSKEVWGGPRPLICSEFGTLRRNSWKSPISPPGCFRPIGVFGELSIELHRTCCSLVIPGMLEIGWVGPFDLCLTRSAYLHPPPPDELVGSWGDVLGSWEIVFNFFQK